MMRVTMVPTVRQSMPDCGLAHLLGQVRDHLFHASRESRLRRSPRHRLDVHPACHAVHSPRRVAHHRHRLPEGKVALQPRLSRLVNGAGLPALRATRPSPARTHVEHQLFPLEPDVFDARRGDAQQAFEYGRDAHGAPSFGDESRNPEPTRADHARPSLSRLRGALFHPHEVQESHNSLLKTKRAR